MVCLSYSANKALRTSRNGCDSMKIAVLGGDGFVGWPTCAPPLRPGPRGPHRRQSLAPLDRHRARRAVADADGLDPGAHPHLAPGDRPAHPLPPARPRPRLRGAEALACRAPARRGHPFRRAARRALFDEDRPAQELHGQQQRQRHPQPAQRAGRDSSSTPISSTSAPWASTAIRPSAPPSRKATCRSASRRCAGGTVTPGHPLPGQPRLDLPHDQDASISSSSSSTPRTTASGSPTCTRASSGAPIPSRPAATCS